MLGTLRMDIDTCIDEYIQLSPQIFPVESSVSANSFIKGFRQASGQPRFEAEPLERAIKRLVVKYLGDEATEGEDTLLRFEASRDRSSPKCKTFVCVTSMKPRRAFRFRSYHSPQDDVEDCPIWQACRATSAAPTLFPPMLIGKLKVPFADGGLGHNNPIRSLMDEAGKLWPSRDSGCIVSIGTGMPASRDLGASFPSLVKSLKEIATDTETVAREFKHEMKSKYQSEQNVYFRFNVPHGLENVGLEEWKEMGRIQTATTDYVSDESSQIAACTLRLHAPGGM
ncbi:MAG: hypothetical protein M1817_003156 [Caeruleum heppii]|nr:MAG: hypothetical protein M1817_003156 [Caeruleum heppii]